MQGPEELTHGTRHHDHMHRCNHRIKRIKYLVPHIDVHAILDDWREEIEKYVMENISNGKN